MLTNFNINSYKSCRGGQSNSVKSEMEGFPFGIRLFNHLGNGGSFTLNGNKTISVNVKQSAEVIDVYLSCDWSGVDDYWSGTAYFTYSGGTASIEYAGIGEQGEGLGVYLPETADRQRTVFVWPTYNNIGRINLPFILYTGTMSAYAVDCQTTDDIDTLSSYFGSNAPSVYITISIT